MATYRYISNKECDRPDCPVVAHKTFEADENGKDKYRVYKNNGTALEVFGEQTFAACSLCLSHVRVEEVKK